MICTVCKKDKPENEFQIYWHKDFKSGTAGRFVTRRQCTTCLYERRTKVRRKIAQQKKEKKAEVIIPQPETKNCWRCGDDYYLEDYFGLDKNGNIKILKERNQPCFNCRQEILQKHGSYSYIDPNGDYRAQVEKIGAPGTYVSEHQREITYMAMEAMGFKLNEKLNIWWKPGYRKENGQFEFLQYE